MMYISCPLSNEYKSNKSSSQIISYCTININDNSIIYFTKTFSIVASNIAGIIQQNNNKV